MFCKVCGTVLDANDQCINCEKKQTRKDIKRNYQTELTSETIR